MGNKSPNSIKKNKSISRIWKWCAMSPELDPVVKVVMPEPSTKSSSSPPPTPTNKPRSRSNSLKRLLSKNLPVFDGELLKPDIQHMERLNGLERKIDKLQSQLDRLTKVEQHMAPARPKTYLDQDLDQSDNRYNGNCPFKTWEQEIDQLQRQLKSIDR